MEFSRSISSGPERAAPMDAPQIETDEIDLAALFATIWRGKWIIILLTTIAVGLGGYYTYFLTTPLYQSTAVVILETKQDQIVDLQSVVGGLSGDTSEVNSEVQVLRSRGLMGKVVDRLDLTRDPEFNGSLQAPSLIDNTKSQLRRRLGLSTPSVTLLAEEEAQRTRDAVITALLNTVTVRNLTPSLVFEVTVKTQDPRKSARIADTIVDLYILNQIEVKFQATEQATVWLTERVASLQNNLEQAEAEVSEFNATTELVSVEGLRALERQNKELRDRIETAENAQFKLNTDLTALMQAETRDARAAIVDDNKLTRFLTRAESDETMAKAFDLGFESVVQRKRLDAVRADQQLAALRASEAELTGQISRQSEDLITLQQLTREAEATRVLYEYFLTRLNETSAQQGIQQADSRILSNAVVPTAPSEPRKSLIVALSLVLGLLTGAALVLLREMRNDGFRTARDLEAASGYTVLGQIPLMPAKSRRKTLAYLSEKPTSAAAEAVRNLRTSLMLSNVDNPPQVILSTSSLPGEGKTTNSLALAQNLLGLGKKVLLVEGDIRRRTLHRYFDDLPQHGIVSVLSGSHSLAETVHRAEGFGADILGGEKSDTNAADLFSSERFRALIQSARDSYDAIIIDTPPVLVVPDARIIANHVDAVIFTVHWDKTSKPQVDEALRLFHNSGQRITGMVLSQISPRGMKRYGYGGKYGAYAGYGAKYYAN